MRGGGAQTRVMSRIVVRPPRPVARLVKPQYLRAMAFDPKLFAERRRRTIDEMRRRGGGVMVVPAGDEKIRSNDSEFLFRQDNDFYYLTGFDEPQGCALLFADP